MAILNTYPDLPLGIQGDEVIVCMPDSDGKTYNFYTADLKTWLEAGLGGDYNIDGGFADSIYTPSQLIDGGGASG